MRAARGAALTLLAVAALTAGASAHSFLEGAEPRPGSTVKTVPGEVRLRFTERLEAAFSTVIVTDERGKRVDRGAAHLEAGAPKRFRVPLLPIGPGRYTVKWRVLSVDSHVVEGEFTFRLAP
jgi:copper resistance protein C